MNRDFFLTTFKNKIGTSTKNNNLQKSMSTMQLCKNKQLQQYNNESKE